MKHNQLHSVANNFADSLASGISLVIGHYDLDVFAVAEANGDRSVLVDFLTGAVKSEVHDRKLKEAVPLFQKAFPEFCGKHGVSASDFEAFVVRYVAARNGCKYYVTIEDREGQRSSKEYTGIPGRRTEVLDHLGRRRSKHLSEPLD